MIASVWVLVSEHLVSFGAGLVLGFYVSDRYRLVKRNGSSPKRDDDVTGA